MRERFRESLRARLRVATELAIGGHVERARSALHELQATMQGGDQELAARYHLAWALLRLKERAIEDAFAAFERALEFARGCGDAPLITGVLTNYGTAVAQDGDVATAVRCFEEAREVAAHGN